MVSHSTGKLDSATPVGVEGIFPTELSRGHRRGLRPSLTPGLNTEHPCRGASLADPEGVSVSLAITIVSTPVGVPRLPIPKGRAVLSDESDDATDA